MRRPIIEICLDRVDSIRHCAAAGIDRIELCHALSEGGLTPSLGMIQHARCMFPGKIMVMIRPRRGDFFYSPEEVSLMCEDISYSRAQGADGVVFGCLLPDGTIDEVATTRLLDAAAGLDCTFHRAFDVSRDLSEALETLIRVGVPRILTSGGQPDVWQGLPTLLSLHQQAAGRITLLPGGGLTAERALDFLRMLPAHEIHLSARQKIKSAMNDTRRNLPMGASAPMDESIHHIAAPESLAMLRLLTLP